MFTVAISGDFFDPGGDMIPPGFDLGPLRRDGIELVVLPRKPRIDAADLAGVDALILLQAQFDAASLPDEGRLALVARFGAGLDTVDVDACTARGVMVTNTAAHVARPMAVAVMTLVLALSTRLMRKAEIGRNPAEWKDKAAYFGTGLTGKTLGSLGFGNIARDMFAIMKPLGMRYLATSRSGFHPRAAGLGVSFTGLEALFAESDVVVINAPLTDETRGMVDARMIGLMKKTAFLVNIGRGPIVDQTALTVALREGRIAGAGLDVLTQEPPDPADPILALDNVIITPHALGWTDQLFADCGGADIEAVLALRRGEVPDDVVNPAVLDHPGLRAILARHEAGLRR